MQNSNFVGVSINTLNVLVMHDMILVGSLNTTQSFTLPPRSDVKVRAGQCGGGALWDSCKQLSKTFESQRPALKYSSTALCTAHQVKFQCL